MDIASTVMAGMDTRGPLSTSFAGRWVVAEVDNLPVQSSDEAGAPVLDDASHEKLYSRMVLFTFFLAGPILGLVLSLKLFGMATVGTLTFAFLTLQNKRYRAAAIVYTGLLVVAVVVCILRG